MTEPVLQISNLSIYFSTRINKSFAVNQLDLTLFAKETLVLLGESGCGKSMTALSILKLLPISARIQAESAIYHQGKNLLALPEVQLRQIRSRKIAIIFQDPLAALNPVLTIEQQITEVLKIHAHIPPNQYREKILALLSEVGIGSPEQRLESYPHQLSGGMKQRAMIAMALAADPEILIADEPTTALDVTIQAQILSLLKGLQEKRGLSILFITHDLGVARQIADRIAVMYLGHLVEVASNTQFFQNPVHPYSQKLLASLPSVESRHERLFVIPGQPGRILADLPLCRFLPRCEMRIPVCQNQLPPLANVNSDHMVRCHRAMHLAPEFSNKKITNVSSPAQYDVTPVVLKVTDLRMHFPIKKGLLRKTVGKIAAVDGVSLEIYRAKTLALVGESGCGKTTIGKAILMLYTPTSGDIAYQGEAIDKFSAQELIAYRRDIQIIFQDPMASMNPRLQVWDIIREGLANQNVPLAKQRARVTELLDQVGLPQDALSRYPHEFSGGQRQRICIARALAVKPKILVCDEPTSALDVSVQAQILNLLIDLQNHYGLSYLFISHNLSVVGFCAHTIAVMYLGKIVEYGAAEQILKNPKHPYTQQLLSSLPTIEEQKPMIGKLKGEIPSAATPPQGCHFHTRCVFATNQCREAYPKTISLKPNHAVNCFLYAEE